MAKRIKLPGRAESAEVGGVVAGANTIYDDAKGKMQDVVNSEVGDELVRLEESKQDNLTFDNAPTEGSRSPVTSGGVYTADKALSDAIEAILLLIPSAASALNQLADKKFVQDSVATSTATFRGTYNVVSDLHLSANASHAQIEAALDALSLGADTNDYCFVQVPDNESTENIKKTERYKFNGTTWAYEYDLNNSGFTAAQWEAINSNITALLVTKLSQLPTNEVLTALLAAKQDNLTFDEEPTAGSNNPVTSGGIATRNNEIVAMITALEAAKQDKLTFDSVPVNGSENPVMSGGVYDAIYLVQVVLAGLDGRMLSAEHSIELLTENVGILRTLYQALSQSDIIVGAKPTTGVANVIYRVPGSSTFADWMYYNGAWVKLAEYTTLDGYLYKGIATPTGSPAASAVKMFYFALIAGTYTNFGNLVVMEGISILKYDGANWTQDKLYYGDGGVFDISKYNLTNGQPTPYPDIVAALGTNGANVPEPLRKGGMSVKFIQGTVQSSDNKYLQYRYMLDDASTVATFTNTENWAICSDNILVESSEFIRVYTDKDNKILWAIKADGTIYFGAGVPPQVVEYVQTLGIDEKVDKVEGKSLIDAVYASLQSTADSTEYYKVDVDTENRILEGIKTTGVKEINIPVKLNTNNVSLNGTDVNIIDDPQFLKVLVDSEYHIIAGIYTNGDIIFGAGVPEQIKEYIAAALSNVSADSVCEIGLLDSNFSTTLDFKVYNGDVEDATIKGQPNAKYVFNLNLAAEEWLVRFKFRITENILNQEKDAVIASINGATVTAKSIGLSQHYETGTFNGTAYSDKWQAFDGGIVFNSNSLNSLVNDRNIGIQAFSVKYTGAGNSVTLANDGDGLILAVDGNNTVYSFANYDNVSELYEALSQNADLELRYFSLDQRTCDELAKFSAISLKDIVHTGVSLTETITEQVDAAPLYLRYAVSDKWHQAEICRIGNTIYCSCEGNVTTISASYSSENILTLGGECGVLFKDFVLCKNGVLDTEYSGGRIISSVEPYIVVFECHGMVDEPAYKVTPANSEDGMSSLNPDTMEYFISYMTQKGYLPVSIEDIAAFYCCGNALPKRCYTLIFDDFRWNVCLNNNFRSVFSRHQARPALAIITSQNGTITHDGETITKEQAVMMCKNVDFSVVSHTKQHRYAYEILPSEYIQYLTGDIYDADKYYINGSVLVYPGGHTNVYMHDVMESLGFKLGVEIFRQNNTNNLSHNRYMISRINIGRIISTDGTPVNYENYKQYIV